MTVSFGTWNWELRTNLLSVGGALAALYGVEADVPVDASIRDAFLPRIDAGDRREHVRRLAAATHDGGPFVTQYRALNLRGEVRQIVAQGATRLDGEGRPVGFFGVMVDATEPARSGRALLGYRQEIASSLMHAKALVAHVSDPVLAHLIDMAMMQVKESGPVGH